MTEDMQKSHKALGKVLTILQEKGGWGKSSAIFNVSYYLSQNYKVLVIDLDGQAADITYYFFGNTIEDRDSILTILDCMRKTSVSVFDVIRPVTENLHLVPANISVTNIATTDKLVTFRKIINELKEVYDYILIDTPPIISMSDAAIAAKQCDGAILVIESEAVSRRDAMKAKDQLMKSGCKLLGAVLNKVDMKKEKYYSKYSSYYYGKSKQE